MKRLLWQAVLALFLLVLAAPLLLLVLWAFARNWPWPLLFPSDFGLRGFNYLKSPGAGTARLLLTSGGLSAVVMVLTLAVSVPAAKALGTRTFRGKRLIHTLVLTPLLVSPLSVAMGIHGSFIRLGLADTFTGVVLIHLVFGIPYAIRILTHAFELLGDRMEVQAHLLGASRIQTLQYVTLPLLAPGLVSAGTLVFIVSFSQYFLTFFIGGGRIVTLPMVLLPFVQSGDRMMASIYSLCFIGVCLAAMTAMEALMRRLYGNTDHHYLN